MPAGEYFPVRGAIVIVKVFAVPKLHTTTGPPSSNRADRLQLPQRISEKQSTLYYDFGGSQKGECRVLFSDPGALPRAAGLGRAELPKWVEI